VHHVQDVADLPLLPQDAREHLAVHLQVPERVVEIFQPLPHELPQFGADAQAALLHVLEEPHHRVLSSLKICRSR